MSGDVIVTEKDLMYLMIALVVACVLWVTGALPMLIHFAEYILAGGGRLHAG